MYGLSFHHVLNECHRICQLFGLTLGNTKMTTESVPNSTCLDYNSSHLTKAPDDLQAVLLDGYDLPVFGLDIGHFHSAHIAALCCILGSFICATLSIVFSFRQHTVSQFYSKWTNSDRFVIYMALFDGLFNISHSLDHAHILITENHVHPKALCVFYAFNLSVFISAQILLVNVVAINAFMLMYFNININFGAGDWKLLLWAVGAPFVGSVVCVFTNQFGPTGMFCLYDGINGDAVLFMFTIPLFVIIIVNMILYALTWKKIHQHTKAISKTIGNVTQTSRASAKTAKSMSLFVAAFIIQWTPLGVHGAWSLITPNVPMFLLYLVVTFSNIGGCMNLAVYMFIRRSRHQEQHEAASSQQQLSTIS